MRRSQRCVAQAVENCVQRWVAGRAAPEQVQLDRLGSSVTPAMPSRLEDAGTKAMPRPPATSPASSGPGSPCVDDVQVDDRDQSDNEVVEVAGRTWGVHDQRLVAEVVGGHRAVEVGEPVAGRYGEEQLFAVEQTRREGGLVEGRRAKPRSISPLRSPEI